MSALEKFPAHIRIDDTGHETVQTTEAHCQNVAQYAARSLQSTNLSGCGELVGLLHDAGKFCAAFTAYLTRAVHGEPVRRGSVNHTFAGVRLLFERYYRQGGPPFRNMVCEILSFAVGAHHGLFDCIAPDGRDGFTHRLDAPDIPYPKAKDNFLSVCTNTETMDRLFDAAEKEIQALVAKCQNTAKTPEELWFHVSMACRLLLSALIDADRRDTAAFMQGVHFPEYPPDMRPLWEGRLAVMEQKLVGFSDKNAINRARCSISQQCRNFPAESGGIYRLSVPTGGGKTLATLRFALATAAQHNKSRIVFVIPLLSVLEQNAKVIREYLDSDDLILEHHSNVVRSEDVSKNASEELDESEWLAETWQSPVVITTMVQLLNTLFSGKSTCIRRMNALANSVIVIDEVQSLPRHIISAFNLAINFLARICQATVVLCSATQPCLEATVHPLQYSQPPDIVPYTPKLWEPFRRTRIIDRKKDGGYTPEELAAFAQELLPESRSLLVICNKKDQAAALYQQLRYTDIPVFHLSTALCMAHRIDTLRRITACLENKTPVICVATQLVEAGVDFSFGCVIRVCAGMDNIVQAAGRCNRHGEFGRLCPVYIVNWHDEKLDHLREIKKAQEAAEELLYCYEQNADAFGGDLQSDQAIAYYYRRLFANMPLFAQDYPVSEPDTTLIRMLADNNDFRSKSASPNLHAIGQAFFTAGTAFRVFDDQTTDVLVPYGAGASLIADFCTEQAQRDFLYRKQLVDKAKTYTVSLFNYQLNTLAGNGGLKPVCDGAILTVLPAFYNDETGIVLGGGAQPFLEG